MRRRTPWYFRKRYQGTHLILFILAFVGYQFQFFGDVATRDAATVGAFLGLLAGYDRGASKVKEALEQKYEQDEKDWNRLTEQTDQEKPSRLRRFLDTAEAETKRYETTVKYTLIAVGAVVSLVALAFR